MLWSLFHFWYWYIVPLLFLISLAIDLSNLLNFDKQPLVSLVLLFFYFNFSDFCSCPYCLFPCPTLDLICSSFLKMFLRLKFRPLTWDIFSFFNISIYAIDFHLSTIWAASHKFWHVFLFSFSLKYLIISFLGGFLTHKLFRSVLFNFQIFQNFLYIFNLWFLV